MLDEKSAEPIYLDTREFHMLNHELNRIYNCIPDPFDTREKTKRMIRNCAHTTLEEA
jgi:hypothetical protein